MSSNVVAAGQKRSEGHPEVARISRVSPAYDQNLVPLTEKAMEALFTQILPQ